MVVRVSTVAFEGVNAKPVDVQVQVMPGRVLFNIVGLPDKAVGESRERVRARLPLLASRFPLDGSPSISRPLICRKKAVILICRSRWD